MNSNMQKCLAIYQQQLNEGTIRKAYIILTKYVSELKNIFLKHIRQALWLMVIWITLTFLLRMII